MPLLPHHQAHDPRALIARWRQVARVAGLRARLLAEVDGERIIFFENKRTTAGQPLVYLSTGVHGDEAGAAWGLLHWAEHSTQRLAQGSFLIFPCLNPHGLRLNTRADLHGQDINRRFHLADDPLCGPWQQLVRQRVPAAGICLHEDYDAQGCYLYELGHHRGCYGEKLLRACTRSIKPDPRPIIDGRRARSGIIRRRSLPPGLPGMPEAIVLWQLGCPLTLTFETPSEFSLDQRVRAQSDFVSAVMRHALPAPDHQP